ncbi:MAG: bifunctional hydroxymethylpyrimidine kinase/phosphomethylpyrimidine kinase [Sulfurimonadaceae bacterium]|jgi:hydroxymethylpyrimidine/phosphomethylpyrimidine kinase|nr:bifunctional hydroxymethylpyrimidine kinase/phosphomethylpyrimidine kinase [Sulfurimonadaceae bacterium]
MKVVLTIAGSDSSGGAGIQADLKTFEAFGVFGASAITVLTAQNTTGVRSLYEVSPNFIKEQIKAVLEDFDVSVIKIGMLYSVDIICAIRDIIKDLKIPIVLDPVFISKVGSPLLQPEAVEEMKTLFPYVSIITPNLYEAQELFGFSHGDTASLDRVINCGAPVLIKNQLLEINHQKLSIDQLFVKHQKRVFESPFVDTSNLHGTGCSYSSAIAANIALGHTLEEAIQISKKFIYEAIQSAPNLGKGAGPVNHKQGGLACC